MFKDLKISWSTVITSAVVTVVVVVLFDLIFSVTEKDYKNFFTSEKLEVEKEINEANKADSSKFVGIKNALSYKIDDSYYSMLYGFIWNEQISNVPKFTRTRVVDTEGKVTDSTTAYVPPENWRKWKDFVEKADENNKLIPIQLVSTNVCDVDGEEKPTYFVQTFLPSDGVVKTKADATPAVKQPATKPAGKIVF